MGIQVAIEETSACAAKPLSHGVTKPVSKLPS